ncbi:hypothetical protein F2981_22725 (plasmid) [Sinorhizobium meliloti]|nr:hypothetical protein [Sinorhizobium meliloti]
MPRVDGFRDEIAQLADLHDNIMMTSAQNANRFGAGWIWFAASPAPAPVIGIKSSLSESTGPFLDHDNFRSDQPEIMSGGNRTHFSLIIPVPHSCACHRNPARPSPWAGKALPRRRRGLLIPVTST